MRANASLRAWRSSSRRFCQSGRWVPTSSPTSTSLAIPSSSRSSQHAGSLPAPTSPATNCPHSEDVSGRSALAPAIVATVSRQRRVGWVETRGNARYDPAHAEHRRTAIVEATADRRALERRSGAACPCESIHPASRDLPGANRARRRGGARYLRRSDPRPGTEPAPRTRRRTPMSGAPLSIIGSTQTRNYQRDWHWLDGHRGWHRRLRRGWGLRPPLTTSRSTAKSTGSSQGRRTGAAPWHSGSVNRGAAG